MKNEDRILNEISGLREEVSKIATNTARMDERINTCLAEQGLQSETLKSLHTEIYGKEGQGGGLKERVGSNEEKTDTIWKVALGGITSGLAGLGAGIGKIVGWI
jgi:chromosome segregation ATPase